MKLLCTFICLVLLLIVHTAHAQQIDPVSAIDDWPLRNARIYDAWAISEGDPNVTVVLGDTGIYAAHPDLEDRVLGGVSWVDDSWQDWTVGHGTFTAGIIAAARGNHIGVAGVCPNCTLWSAKDYPSLVNSASATLVIGTALEHHFSILNYDFAVGLQPQTEVAAIQQAEENSLLIVAAAGNNGSTTLTYPAANSCVLGVGSINRHDELNQSSNRGYQQDIVAPGLTIYSTDLPGAAGYSDSDYAFASGTSFAAPFVSGTAALIRSIRPDLTGHDLFEILLKSARDLGEPGFDPIFGYGALDAKAALDLAQHWQATGVTHPCLSDYERAYGRVTYAGRPAAALVTLSDTAGEIVTTTTTAINGIFHFDIAYDTQKAPYILHVGKESQSTYFRYHLSGPHEFALDELAVEAPNDGVDHPVAPSALQATVRSYGKIIMTWQGNGGEVLDNGVALDKTALQTTSFTLWGYGKHTLQVRNPAGSAEVKIDNSFQLYLPVVSR